MHSSLTSGLAILAVGFLLGMRHATDPDHVIAVSTIVSRERSIPKAGLIGILWGCGHTLTIAIVGSAIILFGLVIPPRAGLTMEFTVGLMLILLGVLNLTGVMKWMSEKFSPAHPRITGGHAHLHGHGAHVHFHWHSHSSAGQHHAETLAPRWMDKSEKFGLFHTTETRTFPSGPGTRSPDAAPRRADHSAKLCLFRTAETPAPRRMDQSVKLGLFHIL